MKYFITERAPAKINLTLDITGRREDGYHTLDSIMHTVSLFDVLDISYDPDDTGIIIECDDPTLTCGEDNLCYKAALAYKNAAKLTGMVKVIIEKRIPISAGLAGGSSDCAATLRALDAICTGLLPREELIKIAQSLGADVPFCLVGGCMRAQGIGEILTPLPGMPDLPIVIARKGEGISAREAYGLFDEAPIYTNATERMVSALEAEGSIRGLLSNAFEPYIYKVRPKAEHLRERFRHLKALDILMSGSGDAVFAVFADEYSAVIARESLRLEGVFAEIAYPYYGFTEDEDF